MMLGQSISVLTIGVLPFSGGNPKPRCPSEHSQTPVALTGSGATFSGRTPERVAPALPAPFARNTVRGEPGSTFVSTEFIEHLANPLPGPSHRRATFSAMHYQRPLVRRMNRSDKPGIAPHGAWLIPFPPGTQHESLLAFATVPGGISFAAHDRAASCNPCRAVMVGHLKSFCPITTAAPGRPSTEGASNL